MDKKTEEIVEHRRLSVAHVVAKRNLDKLEAEFPNKLIGLATSVINSPEHQRIPKSLGDNMINVIFALTAEDYTSLSGDAIRMKEVQGLYSPELLVNLAKQKLDQKIDCNVVIVNEICLYTFVLAVARKEIPFQDIRFSVVLRGKSEELPLQNFTYAFLHSDGLTLLSENSQTDRVLDELLDLRERNKIYRSDQYFSS